MTSSISVYDDTAAKTAHITSAVTETLSAMVESSSYTGYLQVVPVLDSKQRDIAVYGDTSAITFTGDVFVTEKEDLLDVSSDGDYYIDYKNGYYKVVAATSATPTVAYYTSMLAINSVVDVELGAVEIKDGDSDNRLDVLIDSDIYDSGGTRGIVIFGKYQSSPDTYTTEMVAPILLDENGRISLSSDIEIGAVEIKDGESETRVTVSSADTARTTATKVMSVQGVDATGKVSPAGDTVDNAPFVKVGDGTDTLKILTDNAAFSTGSTTGLAMFGRYQTSPSTFDDGDAAPILLDSNGRVVLSSDIEIGAVELKDGSSDNRAIISSADTARTTATNVLAVQSIDSNGEIITLSLIETIESEIEILTGNTATLIGLSGILTGDTSTLISLSETLTGDTATLISLNETLTGDTSTLIGLSGILTGDTTTLISLNETLTGDTRTLIELSGVVTGDTASMRDAIEASLPQAYGIDVAGADAYTTIVTATAERHHMHVSLQGSYDAIVSVNGGTTDGYYIVAGSVQAFDSVLIANGATVQGKNATPGSNYTNLSITIW